MGYNSVTDNTARLAAVGSPICEIPQNSERIRVYSSSSLKGHPRSSILVSI